MTSKQAILLVSFLALTKASLTLGQPHAWADNVCNMTVPVKKDLIIETPVQYEIKVSSMCGILPCLKTRIETRNDQSIKTIIENVIRPACCAGYIETQRRTCAPICIEPCGPGGKCVAPNTCKCRIEPTKSSPGFAGDTCRSFVCLDGQRWGSACERECKSNCTTNSYCSADTGNCVCSTGWHGPNCDLECGPDDSPESGCNFMSQMPPIAEPDANLISGGNLISSRTLQAEALMLAKDESAWRYPEDGDDDVRPMSSKPDGAAQAAAPWWASTFLVSILAMLTLVLLVAFLIVKKRYEFVRNELYHASVSSVGGSSNGSGGPGSEYSASSYYSAGQAPASILGTDKLGKNIGDTLSFAAATRNILNGPTPNQGDGKKILLFSPKTESHLIRSQEASQQNIYSEIGTVKKDIGATPVKSSNKSSSIDEEDDDHTYKVPRMDPSPNRRADCSAINSSVISTEPLLRSCDVSVDLGYDNDSNIYEEIKPRHSDNQRENL